MLMLFTKLKPGLSISLSVLIALGVGYIDWVANYLSLSRTLVFFPFFLLGYYLKKDHFFQFLKVRYKILSALILISIVIGFYFFPELDNKWLLGSKPYDEMGNASILSMATRFGIYLLSLMMIFSFFIFVPRRKYFFTTFGKNTLYVYLLHGFFIRIFRESEVRSYFTTIEDLVFLAALALLLTMVLSSKLVTTITQPIIELNLSKWKHLKQRVRAKSPLRNI
jgi:fucose 4-O-acetylase-like acetyltransferase